MGLSARNISMKKLDEEISEVNTFIDLKSVFPILQELREDLDLEKFISLYQTMRQQGYKLFQVKHNSNPVAVAGFSILTNLYYGKHMWIYDLVVTNSLRSSGIGLRLMKFLEKNARDNDCETIALSSNLKRANTHKFYINKCGFQKASYVFRKKL
jgi:N-acetylglutamate synthase-like GNAT family acetyltransferase